MQPPWLYPQTVSVFLKFSDHVKNDPAGDLKKYSLIPGEGLKYEGPSINKKTVSICLR